MTGLLIVGFSSLVSFFFGASYAASGAKDELGQAFVDRIAELKKENAAKDKIIEDLQKKEKA